MYNRYNRLVMDWLTSLFTRKYPPPHPIPRIPNMPPQKIKNSQKIGNSQNIGDLVVVFIDAHGTVISNHTDDSLLPTDDSLLPGIPLVSPFGAKILSAVRVGVCNFTVPSTNLGRTIEDLMPTLDDANILRDNLIANDKMLTPKQLKHSGKRISANSKKSKDITPIKIFREYELSAKEGHSYAIDEIINGSNETIFDKSYVSDSDDEPVATIYYRINGDIQIYTIYGPVRLSTILDKVNSELQTVYDEIEKQPDADTQIFIIDKSCSSTEDKRAARRFLLNIARTKLNKTLKHAKTERQNVVKLNRTKHNQPESKPVNGGNQNTRRNRKANRTRKNLIK